MKPELYDKIFHFKHYTPCLYFRQFYLGTLLHMTAKLIWWSWSWSCVHSFKPSKCGNQNKGPFTQFSGLFTLSMSMLPNLENAIHFWCKIPVYFETKLGSKKITLFFQADLKQLKYRKGSKMIRTLFNGILCSNLVI